jgi:hypothetical protein
MDKDGALGASLPTSNIVPVQAASTGRAEPDAMLVDPTASGSGESSESAVKTASFDVRKILQVSSFQFSLCLNSQINLSIRHSRKTN